MKKTPSKEQECLQENTEKRANREREKGKDKQLRQTYNKMGKPCDYRESSQVTLPDNFCLADNYKQVVSAINNLRTLAGKKKYINFKAIRQMDIAAALMLAAELEVNKIEAGTPKITTHDSDWNPEVRTLLGQMGFLELLFADSKISVHTKPLRNQIFLKFRSGYKLIGDDTMQMVESLQKRLAPCKLEPELLLHLYTGIFEAITNTRHHAYKHKKQDEELKRWWISASIDTQTNEIKVVCYDRGKTIPKTIKNSKRIPAPLQFLGEDMSSHLSDGDVIITAIKKRISSTKSNNRGVGLSELVRLIDKSQQGALRIYSGTGMAEFNHSFNIRKEPCISRKLSRKMHGTLVEWSITPSSFNYEGIPG